MMTHKIAQIKVSHHRLKLDKPFNASWDRRRRTHLDATIVRVMSDSGIEGVGSGDRMLGFAGHEDLFIGQDPLRIERHFDVLSNLEFHYGRCWPLDLALWIYAEKSRVSLFGSFWEESTSTLEHMPRPVFSETARRWLNKRYG